MIDYQAMDYDDEGEEENIAGISANFPECVPSRLSLEDEYDIFDYIDLSLDTDDEDDGPDDKDDDDHDDDDNDGDDILARYYRKRKQKGKNNLQNILIGKGQSFRRRRIKEPRLKKTNQFPDLVKHLFIYRVKKDTTIEDMHRYIAGMGYTIKALACVSDINVKFKSFRLTVPHRELNQLFDENLWPVGVKVKHYVFPKKKRNKIQ